MRTFSFSVFVLVIASGVSAPPEPKLSAEVCKADSKAWSMQKTETLTITEIHDWMNEMFACADRSRMNEKQMSAHLSEF